MASVEGMRDLTIIGGGPAGLAAAIYGSRSGLNTLVLERQMTGGQVAMTDLIENYPGFPEGISGFERVEADPSIEILWTSQLREIRGQDKVESMYVEFTDKGEFRDIKVDGVFFYVGQQPNTLFLDGQIDVDERGFILTDPQLTTSCPGVFAAGDVRANDLKQVVWAAGEGALAVRGVEQYLEGF